MATMSIESRLTELGLSLPAATKPVASYVPVARTGPSLYVSGQLPVREGKLIATGKVASRVALAEAQSAARQCVLNMLAAVRDALDGNLERVHRVVKLTVFVASDPDFAEQHLVANGASELLVEALGERGRHARSAVGVACLPLNAPVELDAVVEVV